MTRRERIAECWVHGLGVSAGAVAVAVLLGLALNQNGPAAAASLVIYGAALMAMLVCSALYNLSREPLRKAVLRRIDHAVIFVLIAATYTPFLVVRIGGALGTGVLVYVWAVATAGVAVKLLVPGRVERVSVALYLALGWTVVVIVQPVLSSVSVAAVALLAAGGVLYTVGAGIYLWDRLPYNRPVWHALVLGGSACHYGAIMSDIVLPATVA